MLGITLLWITNFQVKKNHLIWILSFFWLEKYRFNLMFFTCTDDQYRAKPRKNTEQKRISDINVNGFFG
jgi:hypothetical protein